MSGIKSTYITPFALALGANVAQIGLLYAIPHLIAMLTYPLAAKVIEFFGDRKWITTRAALASYLFLLPIAAIPFIFPFGQVWILLALLGLSTLFFAFKTLAWSSWMGDLVPVRMRGKFFGTRNAVAKTASFFAVLAAGGALSAITGNLGFAVIFAAAFVLGAISHHYLSVMPDIPYLRRLHAGHGAALHFGEFLAAFRRRPNFFYFVLLMCGMNFAVLLMSPFTIVYMLEVLQIGYLWFTALIALSALTAIFSYPYWGKLADRFGDKAIMGVSSVLVAAVALGWSFVTSPYHIIPLEILIGFGWAGFMLATFNYLLDTTPATHRPIFVADYKLLIGLAMVAGPFLGGLLAAWLAEMSFAVWSGLQILFLLSFCLRAGVAAAFIPRLRALRTKRPRPIREVFWKAVAVYPAKGIAHEITVATHCLSCWKRELKRWI
jgi:MFS family permease